MIKDSVQPLVSFIIPLFNGEQYIEECLQSIESQNYENVEIIVVDDGSTDGGPSIVKRHSGIKIITQKNAGVTAARKTGVEAAKGEWIMFVDADDSVKKDIISAWLPLMKEDTDIIIGKMKEEKSVDGNQMALDLLNVRSFPKAPWLKLFRRALLSDSDVLEIPRDVVWGEDVLMLLRLSMLTKGCVVYSKERNYLYRRHPEQITKTFKVTSEYELRYHELMLRSIPTGKFSGSLMDASIRFRLHLFERILRDIRFTADDVSRSEWLQILKKDIINSHYRPSLWFRMLLKYGNGDNIRKFRSVKWIFKSVNAF